MNEALLYQKKKSNNVQCNLCPRLCIIKENNYGFCGTRFNQDGILYARGYGVLTGISDDPIEKKPLFHFYPGTKVFSIGNFGCNLRCKHCQNWNISQKDGTQVIFPEKINTPETIVKKAIESNCKGIAFTYNEPTINIEFARDTAKLAKQKNLYTVFVTNGYITQEGLDLIGPYMDAWAVDFKGFTNKFYKEICAVPEIEPILQSTLRAKNKWKMHVEVVTNLIPSHNDSLEELEKMANWIKDNLGKLTPWHVTKFYPCYELKNIKETPYETLLKARDIGLSTNLKYVYTGNTNNTGTENTFCPNCGNLLIERTNNSVLANNITNKKCLKCNREADVVL